MEGEVLAAENLTKTFTDAYTVKALDHVSFTIREGEILGVVGESGSGKSTLARAVTKLMDVDEGKIVLCADEIGELKGKALRQCYQKMQMVFQDATGSFDRWLPVGKSIEETLENFTEMNRRERKEEACGLLERVGLKAEYYGRLPSQLSGGECQRAAIARAIAVRPKLLICDEATSALDVSMQAQIVELLKKLSGEMNMAILFISHDLALVSGLCDRVMVMYRGAVVETGDAHEVITCPKEAYTKQLKTSVFLTEGQSAPE